LRKKIAKIINTRNQVVAQFIGLENLIENLSPFYPPLHKCGEGFTLKGTEGVRQKEVIVLLFCAIEAYTLRTLLKKARKCLA